MTSLFSLALSHFRASSKQKNTAEAVFLLRQSVTVRARRSGLLLARFFFDVFHYIADRLQLLRVFIGHFDGKFLFKRHHQLDDIERIRAQIFDKGRLRRDLLGINPELFDNDVLDLFFD